MLSLFFSFNGSIGRLKYFCASLGYYLLSIILYFVFFASAVGSISGSSAGGFGLSILLGFFLYGSSIWASIAMAMKRCRDAGMSPVLVLLFLVLGPFFWLFLCIYKGTGLPAAQETLQPALVPPTTAVPENLTASGSVEPFKLVPSNQEQKTIEKSKPLETLAVDRSDEPSLRWLMYTGAGLVAVFVAIALYSTMKSSSPGSLDTAPTSVATEPQPKAEPQPKVVAQPKAEQKTVSKSSVEPTDTRKVTEPSQKEKAQLKQVNRSLDDLLRQ